MTKDQGNEIIELLKKIYGKLETIDSNTSDVYYIKEELENLNKKIVKQNN